MADIAAHHRARYERLATASEEWRAVKAARAAGLPEPATPALDALNARVPLVTAIGQAMEGQADEMAQRRSAAARKAWETRRANAAR